MSKIPGVSSLTQVTPEGSVLEPPAAKLQKDLGENLGRSVQSNVLQSIIESSPEPASQDLSEYDQMMQEEPEQLPVDEEINETLKLGQAPDLRMEEQGLASKFPEKYVETFKQADPNLYQRGAANVEERKMGRNTIRYNFQGGKHKPNVSLNGGIFDRSENFASLILDPTKPFGVQGLLHPKPEVPNQLMTNSNIGKVLLTANATIVDPNTNVNVINPEFLRVASLITEDVIADQTMSETRIAEQKLGIAMADFGEQADGSYIEGPELKITKMQRNKELGDRLLNEWAKVSGADVSSVDSKTKSYLGDAMKELYYEVNKGAPESRILERVLSDDGQIEFRVTSLGQEMFRQSEATRKLYFPKEHVDALDSPRSSEKIRVSGVKKPVKVADYDQILEAVQVLESIPHFVIPRREKILLATLLPALANGNASPEIIEMSKTINGFGKDKYATFKARQKIAELDGNYDFNPDANMEILKRNIAQSLLGIAKHRGKSVYLTYFIQAFNGRLTAEQSHFNPQNSKQVRFVTGNPEFAILTPGKNSRLENNLREMYSMMILKLNGVDAGDTLTDERMRMFNEGYDNLVKFGEVLKEALDNTSIDANEISAAILKGIPLDSPDFPQFQGLQLDPKYNKLIQSISKKGEDGLSLIDGLIDLYEYDQVLQYNKKNPNTPRKFETYYNAYIDGKTNGLASNGLQLGIRETALRTGVLRSNDSIYAVEDNKDMRDVLAEKLVASLDKTDAFKSTTYTKYGNEATAFHAVAHALFTTRALNKSTTMTFGYGKELDSFKTDLRNYLVLNQTEAAELKEELKGMDPSSFSEKDILKLQLAEHYTSLENAYRGNKSLQESLVEDLFDMYIDQLIEVITPRGIKARKMMYNMAMFHVMMDEVFELETAMGMPIYLGGIDILTDQGYQGKKYGIYTDEPIDVDKPEKGIKKQIVRDIPVEGMYERDVQNISYPRKVTASAIRSEGEGGYIGGYALGGSNPAPVQSIDAATVVRTFSGKSADKLRNVSSTGKPYGLQIYDAFKLDVLNFDVMNKEVNQNWLQANKDYFYLALADEKMEQAFKKFTDKTKNSKDPKEKVSIDIESGYRKIGDFLFSYERFNPDTKKMELTYPSLTSFFKRNLNPFITVNGIKKKKSSEQMTKEARQQANSFMSDLKARGIEANSKELTKEQVYLFVLLMSKAMNFNKDRKDFIYKEVEPARKSVFAEIDREQRNEKMVAQYHAH